MLKFGFHWIAGHTGGAGGFGSESHNFSRWSNDNNVT
jgi:hypothetical protein